MSTLIIRLSERYNLFTSSSRPKAVGELHLSEFGAIFTGYYTTLSHKKTKIEHNTWIKGNAYWSNIVLLLRFGRSHMVHRTVQLRRIFVYARRYVTTVEGRAGRSTPSTPIAPSTVIYTPQTIPYRGHFKYNLLWI